MTIKGKIHADVNSIMDKMSVLEALCNKKKMPCLTLMSFFCINLSMPAFLTITYSKEDVFLNEKVKHTNLVTITFSCYSESSIKLTITAVGMMIQFVKKYM